MSIGLLVASTLVGCGTDDLPQDGTDDLGTDDGETQGPCDPADDAVDESSCGPLASDYIAGDDTDQYDACISDGGTYELYADTPGSAGRVAAFDEIAELLWRNGRPSSTDFIDARVIYDTDQGLGSRVERREDLHYDPIPTNDPDWDSGVDDDKQCSVTVLAEKYPDRCAGPAKLRPLINQAFIDGAEGTGDPNTNAAIVEAASMWFLYISVYKEANTCFTSKAKDCDSAWAYYTGAFQVNDAVIGLAELVQQYSPNTHQRIFDGILATRCVRDLYSDEVMYPDVESLPQEGQDLLADAWEQLDNALHRGYAVVLRQHLLAQTSCEASDSNWAFLQTAGPVLDREATERGAAGADELAAIWTLDTPTAQDVDRAVALLDEIFDCP